MESKVHWRKQRKGNKGEWQIVTYFDPPIMETRLEYLDHREQVVESVILPEGSAGGMAAAMEAAQKTRNAWQAELRRIRAEARVNSVKQIRDL